MQNTNSTELTEKYHALPDMRGTQKHSKGPSTAARCQHLCHHPHWTLAQVLTAPLPTHLHPNALRKAEQGGPRAWISVTEAGKWAGVPSSAFRLVQIQLLYPSRERTNGWKISVSFSVTLPNKRMFKKQDNTSTPLECYNHKVRAQQMLAKTGQKMVQPIWRTASQFFKWLSIKLPRDQQFHSYICMSTKERGTNVHGILFITTRNNSNTHQQMKG